MFWPLLLESALLAAMLLRARVMNMLPITMRLLQQRSIIVSMLMALQPVIAQKTAKPVTAQKTAKPVTAQKTAKPVIAQKTAKPVTAQKTAKPVIAQKTAKPADVVNNSSCLKTGNCPDLFWDLPDLPWTY